MTLVIKKPTTSKLVFKNINTPAAIAGATPTIDYRFALDRSAVNRGSNASATISATVDAKGTFVGPGAYIQQATANQLRFDTDPLTLLCRGVLVEAQRTNLIAYSQQFEQGTWSKTGLLTTGSPAWVDVEGFSPAGAAQAEKLIPNTSSTSHFAALATNPTVTTNTAYTNSVFMKSSGYRWAGLSDNSTGQAVFDLLNGTVASADSGITGLTPVSYGNGWWRVAIRYTPSASPRGFGIDVWSDASKTTFAGNGSSGVLVWGAQMEQGSNPSSYIPTTTTSLTRSADSIIINAGLTGTYTMVEKPAGCAVVSGSNIVLQAGYTVERVMSFPVSLAADQITAIRSAM